MDYEKEIKGIKSDVKSLKTLLEIETVEPNEPETASYLRKKERYMDSRAQRAYYLTKEMIAKVNDYSKRKDVDKSDIVMEGLKLFFEKYKP